MFRPAKDFRLAHHPQTDTSVVVPEHIVQAMFAHADAQSISGCWIFTAPASRNPASRCYPKLSWDANTHIIGLHRLALIVGTDAPAPNPLAQALHACNCKRCVNPAHLRWGSHNDNVCDYRRHLRVLERTGRTVVVVPMSRLPSLRRLG